MSFSYVKQKSEDSPKVSGSISDAERLNRVSNALLRIEPGCAPGRAVHVSGQHFLLIFMPSL